VGGDGQHGLWEALVERSRRAVQVLLLSAGDHHLRAVLRQTFGYGDAEAAAAPGHYRHTPGEAKVRHCG
jgi:hypothetical protein